MDDERSPFLPDVPSVKELGMPLVYGAWRGIAAPKDTPQEIIDILGNAFRQVIQSEAIIEQFANAGLPISFVSAEDFHAYIQADYENVKGIMHLLDEDE